VVLDVARSKVVETHPYLEERGLHRKTLDDPRFRGTWRQADGPHANVIFLHHDSNGLSGYELKNRGYTRFAKGGSKGLWASTTLPADHRLVIAESAIDALSYHQVNPHPMTRYVSFAGSLNPEQPALLERAISWMPAGSTVVAATDKEKDGHEFAARIAELCGKHPHVTNERHVPQIGKDWNDHLRALRSPTLPARPSHTPSLGLDR